MVTTVEQVIDFDKVSRLTVDRSQANEFVEYVKSLVRDNNFRETDDTRWAYSKVATFLEDGWSSQLSYTKFQPDWPEEHRERLGFMINLHVCGGRFEAAHAKQLGTWWVKEGEWPTRCDAAAYLFFVATKSTG